MDTNKLIDRVIAAHNGNPRSAIAYLLGRIESEENQTNRIRSALFVDTQRTTVEWLSDNSEASGRRDKAAFAEPDGCAGYCTTCGGPVFHRDGKPGEFNHVCNAPRSDSSGTADERDNPEKEIE